ncbi:MAG: hypothetical protein ABW214_02885, partial [Terrimicrobiaceae bacterium]
MVRIHVGQHRARLRYMRVDPNNRLVADTLEAQWNEKLRVLAQVKEECEQQRRLDSAQLSQAQKAQILSLASEFPRLWRDLKQRIGIANGWRACFLKMLRELL